MIDTSFDIEYTPDTDVLILRVRDTDITLVASGDDFIAAAKGVKKTRKKAKKNVETKTLTQTITKVKFKKIKSGKSYRITETNGTIYETVADHDAEDNGVGTYFVTGNEDYFSFFSQDVESVYLIETSEIS